jgi:hypothetical protein
VERDPRLGQVAGAVDPDAGVRVLELVALAADIDRD